MSFAVFSGTCETGEYKFPFRACVDVLFLTVTEVEEMMSPDVRSVYSH